jgi:hypothetical protein
MTFDIATLGKMTLSIITYSKYEDQPIELSIINSV